MPKVRRTAAVRVSEAVDGTRRRRPSTRSSQVTIVQIKPHPMVWAYVLANGFDLRRCQPQPDGSVIVANERVR